MYDIVNQIIEPFEKEIDTTNITKDVYMQIPLIAAANALTIPLPGRISHVQMYFPTSADESGTHTPGISLKGYVTLDSLLVIPEFLAKHLGRDYTKFDQRAEIIKVEPSFGYPIIRDVE